MKCGYFEKVCVKKEKQLWTSHRCFPGCVLEVVCLIRRWKYEKVAHIRKILDKCRIYCLAKFRFASIGRTAKLGCPTRI